MKTLESLDYNSLIFYHHQAWYCDGTPDCEDKSDEPKTCGVIDCQNNYFKCDNSKCIYKSFVCDGTDDCGDNSDESSKHACSAPEVVCESGTGFNRKFFCLSFGLKNGLRFCFYPFLSVFLV